MNERIKLLGAQAGFHVTNFEPDADIREPLEKFAELIVKECGRWIVDNAGAMEHLGPEYFAKAMTKDFGVEE
jgi:hypothetical protein